MSLKERVKTKAKGKIKKIAFKVIKPFLPFIVIIIALFFAICTIIDAIFIQAVQTDNSYMEKQEQDIRQKCIEKSIDTSNKNFVFLSKDFFLKLYYDIWVMYL